MLMMHSPPKVELRLLVVGPCEMPPTSATQGKKKNVVLNSDDACSLKILALSYLCSTCTHVRIFFASFFWTRPCHRNKNRKPCVKSNEACEKVLGGHAIARHDKNPKVCIVCKCMHMIIIGAIVSYDSIRPQENVKCQL